MCDLGIDSPALKPTKLVLHRLRLNCVPHTQVGSAMCFVA